MHKAKKNSVPGFLFFIVCTLLLLISPGLYAQQQISSGRINTMGKFAFMYGRLEAQIKLPQTDAGLWPAFWLLGADYPVVGWPACGEIDVMEMGHAQGIAAGIAGRYLSAGCHWGLMLPGGGHPNYTINTEYSKNLQDGFHLYTLAWDPKFIRMYIDDDPVPYYEINIDMYTGDFPAGNYFHKEFFIVLNLAVGGSFTGINNPEGITALNNGNDFSASMYVNYVRVYNQKNELIWHDEFDNLDENKWNIEVRNDGGGNSELQAYCRENVLVAAEPESGESCLVLTAKMIDK